MPLTAPDSPLGRSYRTPKPGLESWRWLGTRQPPRERERLLPASSRHPATQFFCSLLRVAMQSSPSRPEPESCVFRLGDHAQIVCKPFEDERLEPRAGAKSSRLLFHDDAEQVTLEATGSPDASLTIANERGLECMILSGAANARDKSLGAHGWGRLPAGDPLVAKAGADSVQVWIKGAPLRYADILPMPL